MAKNCRRRSKGHYFMDMWKEYSTIRVDKCRTMHKLLQERQSRTTIMAKAQTWLLQPVDEMLQPTKLVVMQIASQHAVYSN